MDPSVFNQDHIAINDCATTQTEAFKAIARFAYGLGFVSDEQRYCAGLIRRENQGTTGFKDHIAIPHCKDAVNIRPGMFVMKFDNPIDWNALDGKPVRVAIALTIPEKGAVEHLKLLSLIARKLIDQTFREGILNQDDPEALTKMIDQIDFRG
ncbi:PTS system D-fructose-specific IIA component (F1P-forming), Frc family [Coriobacterium glomerans PW2]|uniref:PTS system D-fructose-specific IIA component (F1P-forming), Frc family n=2 Tax=Coriobacterium TaxID=33870 RepID=F2N9L4_CORGP|nr:PTS system D-fructose-specific IIA component (F1P-forming), Frc family [Coriobacterium glomerans PW2]